MTAEFQLDESVLPTALIENDQWICWREQERDGKPTKVPITPKNGEFASSTDEQTWTSFDEALEYAETGEADGIGFVFTDADPFVGIDLDDCRDQETGAVDEAAQNIIDRLDSYTERSPSGTGYHIIVEGELPSGRNRKGTIEMYDSARFFTVTGEHVAETPTMVTTRQDALAAVHREYVQDDVTDDEDRDLPSETAGESSTAIDLDDEELLEKARNATNGEKFERLWNGNTGSYESQSEADMALCFLLAFWTGGDATWMDQLFRQSGLMREKWDEVHYADGSTYGEKTVERAIAGTSEFYDPDAESTREIEDDVQRHGVQSSAGQREQTYLTEKNRLLKERITELEATLEQKDDRIDTLEATVRDLRAALAERESEIEQVGDQGDGCGGVNEGNSAEPTVWTRAKRFLGDDR